MFVLLDVKRGVAYGTITQMNLALFVMCVLVIDKVDVFFLLYTGFINQVCSCVLDCERMVQVAVL